MKIKSFDVLGNIALVRFPKGFKAKDKKELAKNLLKKNRSVKTVLEKLGKVKGRLRKQETKWLLGQKIKEVLYKENGCVFRFNIDCCYFSPRLSNERKEIASLIKKNDEVLVIFAGVAPFSIVIAKNSKVGKVYSNEINREANKYAKLNIELNKVKDKVVLLPGDIKKVARRIKGGLNVKGKLVPLQFNVIVMTRPQLKESFLKEAFMLSKSGTKVYYYDFCEDAKIKEVAEKIKSEARKYKKRIKILHIKKAGEVAPYKFRIRVDFKVIS